MNTLKCVIVLLALLGLSLVGCYENLEAPVETTASTDNTAPVLMKPPSESGKVVRYQDVTGFWFRDKNAGYTLFLGYDIRESCDFIDQFDEFDFKDVFLPNTDPDVVERIVSLVKGDDISAFVWNWSDPTTQGCEYYQGTDPVAIGTANFDYTDNDVLAWMLWPEYRHNANSYGFKANGTLMGTDGRVYKLNFVWRETWGEHHDNFHMKIQLTPTGGN